MLWITLIWLWNGANLSIYVTHFVPNIRHKATGKWQEKKILRPCYDSGLADLNHLDLNRDLNQLIFL